MVNSGQVIAMDGNINFPKKQKRTITIDLTNEEHMAFKARANSVGLDMTKVMRQMIERYLNMDRREVEEGVARARLGERDTAILSALREFSATHRDNTVFLEGMDRVLGLKPGTLYSMGETVL